MTAPAKRRPGRPRTVPRGGAQVGVLLAPAHRRELDRLVRGKFSDTRAGAIRGLVERSAREAREGSLVDVLESLTLIVAELDGKSEGTRRCLDESNLQRLDAVAARMARILGVT